uniref:Uncharacterized protein n=1 Tax=Glossina austeni TaxID=7395 RepID=A0A1A9UUJ6_GLOAU
MRQNAIRFIAVNSGGTKRERNLFSLDKEINAPLKIQLTYVPQTAGSIYDSELEEFETPARYRPDSLSALSRSTRFTEDEIKRIYRGFKAECPTGVVKEDTFKLLMLASFIIASNYIISAFSRFYS